MRKNADYMLIQDNSSLVEAFFSTFTYIKLIINKLTKKYRIKQNYKQ